MNRKVLHSFSLATDAFVAAVVSIVLGSTLAGLFAVGTELDRLDAARAMQSSVERALTLNLSEEVLLNNFASTHDRRFLSRATSDGRAGGEVMRRFDERLSSSPALRRELALPSSALVEAAEPATYFASGSAPGLARLADQRSGLVDLSARLGSAVDARALHARESLRNIAALFVIAGSASLIVVILALRARAAVEKRRGETRHGRRLDDLVTLANAIDALLWGTTADGRLNYLSRRWVDFLGRTLPELLLEPWTAFLHPDDVTGFSATWLSSRRTGLPLDADCRFRTANGEFRWIRSRAVALHDEAGSIVGWFGAASDIDERRRRAERAQTERAFVEPQPALAAAPAPSVYVSGNVRVHATRMVRNCGNDWYDVVALDDGRTFVSLGYTSDRRLGDASEAVRVVQRTIAGAARLERSPDAVLARANHDLLVRRRRPVVALCGYLDPVARSFHYATAGYAGPFLRDAATARQLEGGGPSLGLYAGSDFPTATVALDCAFLTIIDAVVDDDQRARPQSVCDVLTETRPAPACAETIGARVRDATSATVRVVLTVSAAAPGMNVSGGA